ncbi:hypothetical protein LIER_24228 [Lithospermum erythrorhizon]|uniref:Uncharacterized protein n=1 Tax=Lithospermum erythrorhizon TaxID=34254 RepID=A0AAV3R1K0_LITER
MKRPVWDCESSLYDSFELKSFERQLDSAITSTRSLSMPHLTNSTNQPQSHHHRNQTLLSTKKSWKISRSFYKMIKSFFKTNNKHNSNNNNIPVYQSFGIYDERRRNCEVLTTIPESPEFDVVLSPEMRSVVTRTSSARFSATSIGISCV